MRGSHIKQNVMWKELCEGAMRYDNYSVLMAVYCKDDVNYFEQALDSILNQTKKTNDLVLVCDGPLTDEQEEVIRIRVEKAPQTFQIVRLEKNQGLGKALNCGILQCKNTLVARMDSDDISIPARCQMQLEYFNKHPECDVLSGTIAEFERKQENVVSFRKLPEKHEDIIKFAKKRCPINHPCVMYKKEAVVSAGNYGNEYRMEDYYLWIRMIERGFIFHNLSDVLLYFRSGKEYLKRRSGFDYCKSICSLRYYQFKKRQITLPEYIGITSLHSLVAFCPDIIRKYIYHNYLRESNN